MRDYALTKSQQDDIEVKWYGCLYARTRSVFEYEWKVLVTAAQQYSKKLAEYFVKNWLADVEMWSTYARSAYLSVGNSTTNRLVATWKQMKAMLNLRSSLDKCLIGVLKYMLYRY